MTLETQAAIRDHARLCYPLESCGLIIIWKGKERYVPCRNLYSGSNSHFEIDQKDYAAAEESGEVIKIVHSHPNEAPIPSSADLTMCEETKLPWVIVNWPTGVIKEFQPTGYQAPLVGRVFTHGVLDCYTLIRDFYKQELLIDLPDFEREDDWWKKGQDLYRKHFAEAGFFVIEKGLRKGDLCLMQLGSDTTNHGAVYLGDGLILHHPMNRLSGRDVYGGFWQSITTLFLRHERLK